nr:outer membrane beta-barrel protein [uncultured Rhodoferax sp.]
MKKILIAVAAAATFAAPQAFAQAKNFEGFSVLGALNTNNNNIDIFVASTNRTTSATKSSTNAGLQAEYGLALGQSFVLGLGATVGLSDYDISSDGVKLKDTYGFYVAPGFAVSDNTLVYAKAASISAKLTSGSTTVDLSGIGYGFGGRYFSSKNVFFQAEYTYNKYDTKTLANGNVKDSTGVLSLGVGYKF